MKGEDYADRVFAAVRAEIAVYIALATVNLSAADRSRLRITITVVTTRDAPGLTTRIREYAAQAFDVDLNHAQLRAVYLDIDSRVSDPDFRIGIEPPANGGPDADADTQRIPSGLSTARLTLTYDSDLRLEYRLSSAQTWLPLGRHIPERDTVVPVEVPRFVAAVPRGLLLLIRYWDGKTEIRRTRERSMYLVVVDGRQLLPDRRIACLGHGAIEYHDQRRGGEPSVIRYQLTQDA
jgi:hypothetical protein